MIDVVREADGDAALLGVLDRADDDGLERGREVEVVDRDLERALRRAEELGERVRGHVGGLTAVGQRADVDQALRACHSALCARFAAW